MKNLCVIFVSAGLVFSAGYQSNHSPVDRDWYGFISSMYYDSGDDSVVPGSDDQVNRKRRHKRRRKMRPSKRGLDR